MSSFKSPYQRTLSAARKIGEAFRKATKALRGCDGLSEKFAWLDPDAIPEDVNKHHPGYIGAILEFAAQHTRATDGSGNPDDSKEVDRKDVRAFATHFINKRPEYSRSKNGIAASQMEGWLIKSSGHLFERFVETVLERGNKYLAIFEGKLNSEEVRKMRAGIAEFTTFERLIEAGDHNGEETFEFTVLDCTATGSAKEKKEPELQTDKPSGEKSDDVKLPGVKQSMESLLPDSRDEYDAVCEQGGLSRAALCVVAGDDIFETLVSVGEGECVKDPNGITWVSEDGQTWVPDADSLDEAYVEYDKAPQRPRNYRIVGDGEPALGACETCRYYRSRQDEDYFCTLYGYGVGPEMTCDMWEARQEGLSEDVDDAVDEAAQAVSSDYGAWGVVHEDGQTIVSVRDDAWVVPHPYDEVLEGIVALGEMYEELPAERDLMVEAYLRDYAEECGALCAAPVLIEGTTEYTEERDTLIEENNRERLEELSECDGREALLEQAGDLVDEQYPDVEQGGEQWHQLRMGIFGSLSRELIERQKETPELAFAHEDPPTRKGAFKVSGKALRIYKKEVRGFKGPQDAMFKRVKQVVGAIPREDLPKFFGLNGDDAAAIPDAQDVVARQPRKAFQIFMRRLARVHPKLHGYLQKAPSNASIIFHMLLIRLSGEMMANQIFKRYFSTESDHPESVMRRTSEADDEEDDGKKQ